MVAAALDLGAKRIGIAVTDAAGISAHPLCTIDRRTPSVDFEAIRVALGGRHLECIVVGLPVNMDGSDSPMTRHARNFAARLAEALKIPVELHDERLSSFEAERRLAGSVRRGRMKAAIDAVSAAVILEGWLEARHANRSG